MTWQAESLCSSMVHPAAARPPCCAAWRGLWPYVEGSIEKPEPSDIYVLCAAAVPAARHACEPHWPTPLPPRTSATTRPRDALRAVQLGHLADRLDCESDWSKTLSPGEQQRLAFGRILLARPSLIFLDETTSALDEGMEHAIYELVRERLPECTIVSVGHRSTLERLHTNELTLLGDGTWETRSLVV